MNKAMIAAAALVLAAAAGAADPVAPAELARRIADAGTAPFVLDVRTPEEFAAGRVPGAVNIPVQTLEQRLAEVPKDREVVVYCEKGGRASRAGGLLTERGYPKVRALAGSMSAWRAAGLPVER